MITRSEQLTACCTNLYELPLTSMLLGDSFHPGGEDTTRRLADLSTVGPGSHVLDVACGAGNTTYFLADEFGAKATGIDLSSTLLQRATQNRQSGSVRLRPTFSQARVENLPFSDNSFDVVFCECALCTFPYPEKALSEFLRVLSPGGRLAVSDIVINRTVPPALQTLLAHSLCIAGAHSVGGYESMIAAAGFNRLTTRMDSQVMFEMVDRIERRLKLGSVLAELQNIKNDAALPSAKETLSISRNFIESGGTGYALFTAWK